MKIVRRSKLQAVSLHAYIFFKGQSHEKVYEIMPGDDIFGLN
jgi:hypothetical protein